MCSTKRSSINPVLFLAAIMLLLYSGAAHAQRRCGQRQQNGQSQLRAMQQQNALRALQYGTQPFAAPQNALQQNALQQYALQQAALQAQLNALQQYAFMAQTLGPDAGVQLPLNDLLHAALQQNGQLTPAQLQQVRQQQAALANQLQPAQNRSRR